MPPTDTAVSVSSTLVEMVMIILPIWLAGIRYFVDDIETEEETDLLFSQMAVLLYVSLAAVLVSAGTVLTNLDNDEISTAIYGLWLLFFGTGALTFWPMERRIESGYTTIMLKGGSLLASILIVACFLLMMLSAL